MDQKLINRDANVGSVSNLAKAAENFRPRAPILQKETSPIQQQQPAAPIDPTPAPTAASEPIKQVDPVPPQPTPQQEVVYEDGEDIEINEATGASDVSYDQTVDEEDEDPEQYRIKVVKSEVERAEKQDNIPHAVFLGNTKEFVIDNRHLIDQVASSDEEDAFANDTRIMDGIRDYISGEGNRFNNRVLRGVEHPEHLTSRYKDTIGSGTVRARKPRYDQNGNIVELVTGEDAIRTMSFLSGGGRRVDLPNSGFYITVRNLTLRELNNYYNFVTSEYGEYGHRFGHFFFGYHDVLIKRNIINELLPVVISGSNYQGWKSKNKLLSAISLQDYDVILWAMGVLLYPEGYKITFRCPHCHSNIEELCDLSKLYLLNADRINDNMVTYYREHARSVTDEDLVTYREISNFKREIRCTVGENEWIFEMRQATLANYLDAAEDFNTHLKTELGNDFKDKVDEYMIFNRIRIYLPWIASVTCEYDGIGKDGKPIRLRRTATEPAAISRVLDNLRASSLSLERDFINYIADTKIAYIAFNMPECPRCKHKISEETNGFIPFNAEQSFFILTFKYLTNDRLKRAKKLLRDTLKGTTDSLEY